MPKPKPLSWCQQKILEQLPDDGVWRDVMPDWDDDAAIHLGPCAKSSTLRGLASRGLIELRPQPDDPRSYLRWITDGQIRKVRRP